MTTIAFKDGVFVSDSGTTRGDVYDGRTQKLYQTKYWTLGFAGDTFVVNRALQYFKKHDVIEPLDKELTTEGFSLIAFNHAKQRLYAFNNRLDCILIEEDKYAIGSGGAFAMVALEMGATLKEAVKIACKYDTHSFEPLKEMKVKA